MHTHAHTAKPLRKPRRQQPIEAAENPAALLKIETLQTLTGLGRSKLYAMVRAGTFPRPAMQTGNCTRWRAGDVTDWLAAAATSGVA